MGKVQRHVICLNKSLFGYLRDGVIGHVDIGQVESFKGLFLNFFYNIIGEVYTVTKLKPIKHLVVYLCE